MKKNLVLFIMILFFVRCSTDEEDSVNRLRGIQEEPDVIEQNNLLGKGINMGNMLEAPYEGAWGEVLDEDEYFSMIAGKGFNSVRIPIKWSVRTEESPEYKISEEFLKRVKNAVDEALENDLAVIINIHHYEEIMSDPTGQKERFLAIWKQLSNEFKDYPKEVFFEILNEPNDKLTADLWNQFLNEAIEVIRKENPFRTFLVGTAEWGGISGIDSLILPPSDRNIIVTVHYYNPFEFTHQGASWVDNSDKWLGTNWGSADDKNSLLADLLKLKTWSNGNNRPIHIGEFGAYSMADIDSRAAWTSFVVEKANSFGFSWAYWEFSSGFGVYENESETWNNKLLNALIQ